jgi:hypothetical protein
LESTRSPKIHGILYVRTYVRVHLGPKLTGHIILAANTLQYAEIEMLRLVKRDFNQQQIEQVKAKPTPVLAGIIGV